MSKYICDTCNKPKPIDTSLLKVGDAVNFTVQSIGRKTAGFRSKTGVITAIEGDKCCVETKGAVHVVDRDSLTPSDAPSPLTWIFGGCECKQEPVQEATV